MHPGIFVPDDVRHAVAKAIAGNVKGIERKEEEGYIPRGTTLAILAGSGKLRPSIDILAIRRDGFALPWGSRGVFQGLHNGDYLLEFEEETLCVPLDAVKEPERLESWMDAWKFEDGYDDGHDWRIDNSTKLSIRDPKDAYGLGFVKGWYDADRKRYSPQDLAAIAPTNAYNEVVRILLEGNDIFRITPAQAQAWAREEELEG